MAIGRALNASNDIYFSGGRSAFVRDGAETVQHTRTRLLFYRGEWFLDISAGVPYLQDIFVKPARLPLTESLIKQEILSTPGVKELTAFELSFSSRGEARRRVTVTFSANTIYGVVEGLTINLLPGADA